MYLYPAKSRQNPANFQNNPIKFREFSPIQKSNTCYIQNTSRILNQKTTCPMVYILNQANNTVINRTKRVFEVRGRLLHIIEVIIIR